MALLFAFLQLRCASRGWVRQESARAPGRLRDARAIELLRTLLADPKPDVIQQAREAIAQLEGHV